jgi:hypothetical protein
MALTGGAAKFRPVVGQVRRPRRSLRISRARDKNVQK